ncbi:50S ribosomal protein L25 [Paenibacillus darwinianus]|uniref:Large ribosomal subunit protein bL25 n=1 Tax=Paenibacillus darwinianus TaxID=1380763 RepID=A0A9W5RZS4_9BACL|nr:50S ribosomal protein L25/general stress protein Ctc [Paenibacillus darwinianus]EXX86332.1 50S ribosomal protein L25 [Paenibacillus darwinianus]EXX86434.1 50S ribosomal protein L25 [Paenibacillus darwinianus]EXX88559.1 50S ribosomal protein L25 [Paenibacillus darwinianus]
MTFTMKAEKRQVQTKSDLRQLRQQGKVPGVVYGKNIKQPTAIAVNEKELLHLLRSHPNAVLELELPSAGNQPVMMSDVQRDPLSRGVLHIDFHQINLNEEVKAQVRLEVVGEAPGDKEGGILQLMLHELDVQCLPRDIPESIVVDVSNMQIGENILISDLKLPKGVLLKSDPEQVVVTILTPQKDITEEEAEDAAVEAEEAEARAKEAQAEEVKTEA